MQAGAALLAVIVAAPALWVAVATYQDQIRVTEAQLESTQLDRQRYQERYARRVTFWNDRLKVAEPRSLPVVTLQNRAPVPVREIYFIVDVIGAAIGYADRGQHTFAFPADVHAPPCTILTFRLLVTGFPDGGSDNTGDADYSLVRAIRFTDTVQWWELEPNANWGSTELGGPKPLSRDKPFIPAAAKTGYAFYAAEVPGTREAASDCGESG
ncbi:hypothetical protein Q3W71_25040 [Micromonospora sp. C28SCA-DRY-2]|uniref:hypothetical protein n=1 Tax=Micromonospora sp. C28SCA-DRY-2 TaxID=3059522 RepID=UPI002676E0D4|nr:hypothetical protein [Micromonospora sp. C28SCA-DRY-2]MDO3704937.1 hypothetical protein [Micromonospora sp. C28SCA-DRY-2]